MRARVRNSKIEITDLFPFPIVLSKRSPYVLHVTKTAIFIRSPLVRDLVLPVPISSK